MWWRVVVAAMAASAASVVVFQMWLSRTLIKREGIIQLINRVTGGDLSLSAREIVNQTQSLRTATAMRGLVANLERTIRRFGQLAADVARASDQISGRSRVLSRSATDQLSSTETTSSSVTQIDQTINNVRRSMEELSGNAEETSTSVLEMSASIEEVSRIADTLAEFVEQTSSAIEEMIASINEVATNTDGGDECHDRGDPELGAAVVGAGAVRHRRRQRRTGGGRRHGRRHAQDPGVGRRG
jgi:methyl-accepting chemotaxis protein